MQGHLNSSPDYSHKHFIMKPYIGLCVGWYSKFPWSSCDSSFVLTKIVLAVVSYWPLNKHIDSKEKQHIRLFTNYCCCINIGNVGPELISILKKNDISVANYQYTSEKTLSQFQCLNLLKIFFPQIPPWHTR